MRWTPRAQTTAFASLPSMVMVAATLIGAAVVALGVLGYAYYRHTHGDEARIDFPGFSRTISKDKGIDIEVRKKQQSRKEQIVGILSL